MTCLVTHDYNAVSEVQFRICSDTEFRLPPRPTEKNNAMHGKEMKFAVYRRGEQRTHSNITSFVTKVTVPLMTIIIDEFLQLTEQLSLLQSL